MDFHVTPELHEALTEAKLPLDKDGMLLLWQNTKEQAAKFKALEMDYRRVCAAFLVPDPINNEGTNTVPIGNGYVAKVGIKMNYKLKENKAVWDGLDKIKNVGNDGAFIADRLVSWTPNFLKTEYTNLQEQADEGSQSAKEILKIISGFLVIDEAAPTLTIVEPKKGKK